MVQAAPGGNFVAYDGAAKDLVLVGTRNSAGANALVALNVVDGTEMWRFENLSSQGGDDTDIGIISGAVTVVYATHRLFFASRQKTGGSANTIWCIEFGSGSPNLLWAKPIGNIDGSPTLWGGVLYVGTNAGSLYGLAAADGTNKWAPLALGDGAIKGFRLPSVRLEQSIRLDERQGVVHRRQRCLRGGQLWMAGDEHRRAFPFNPDIPLGVERSVRGLGGRQSLSTGRHRTRPDDLGHAR